MCVCVCVCERSSAQRTYVRAGVRCFVSILFVLCVFAIECENRRKKREKREGESEKEKERAVCKVEKLSWFHTTPKRVPVGEANNKYNKRRTTPNALGIYKMVQNFFFGAPEGVGFLVFLISRTSSKKQASLLSLILALVSKKLQPQALASSAPSWYSTCRWSFRSHLLPGGGGGG